jgi:ABC-type branched-subunit amino acid transport system ATPase component
MRRGERIPEATAVTHRASASRRALEVSDFATVLQVGKSVLSGPAAALAGDPQVQKAYLGTG